MTNKEKYRELCKVEKTIPIFSKDWWLDSVTDGSWDVVLVEKNGEIQASLPYVENKKMGKKVISQPLLTQRLGPWVRTNNVKKAKKIANEKNLLTQLYSALPQYAMYLQSWSPQLTNWLPMYWMGFSQTTRYTYIIDLSSGLDSVWDDIDTSYRNKVRKAEKIVTVKTDLSIENFFLINEKTFKRQGLDIPYSLDFLIKHHQSLTEHKAVKIFYAIDENNQIHSALYLTWDEMSSYVHMVGEDPEYRNSGAGILLIWEALKYTHDILKLKKFDFEGSMIESIEKVRRDFGATPTPYFLLKKVNSKLMKMYFFLRDL